MEVPIDEIKVGKRARASVGKLFELIADINEIGLLHPIVITKDKQLIAGNRRLEACKMLHWKTIPATVVDLDLIARGELSENVHRLDLLPSEKMALSELVEEHELEQAKERQKKGGGDRTSEKAKSKKSASGNLPEALDDPEESRSRDRIGRAVGMSGKTYEKAKEITVAAETDSQAFGDLPQMMDDKSVNAAHKELKRREDSGSKPAYPDSDAFCKWLEDIRMRTDGILLGEQKNLTALLDSDKWDPKQTEFVRGMLWGLHKTLFKFLTETEKWLEKNGKKNRRESVTQEAKNGINHSVV